MWYHRNTDNDPLMTRSVCPFPVGSQSDRTLRSSTNAAPILSVGICKCIIIIRYRLILYHYCCVLAIATSQPVPTSTLSLPPIQKTSSSPFSSPIPTPSPLQPVTTPPHTDKTTPQQVTTPPNTAPSTAKTTPQQVTTPPNTAKTTAQQVTIPPNTAKTIPQQVTTSSETKPKSVTDTPDSGLSQEVIGGIAGVGGVTFLFILIALVIVTIVAIIRKFKKSCAFPKSKEILTTDEGDKAFSMKMQENESTPHIPVTANEAYATTVPNQEHVSIDTENYACISEGETYKLQRNDASHIPQPFLYLPTVPMAPLTLLQLTGKKTPMSLFQ